MLAARWVASVNLGLHLAGCSIRRYAVALWTYWQATSHDSGWLPVAGQD